jgi:hypothetical protein
MSDGPSLVMFDPVAVWRDLSDAERDRIGAAALAYVAAGDLCEYVDEATAQDNTAWDLAVDALEEAVGTASFFQGDGRTVYVPDLNAIGIPQCRECRCTDGHACEGGCHWVRPGLCSACASPADRTVAGSGA